MHTLLMLWVAAVPVSGRVIDTQGKPVPHATVQLSEPITESLGMNGHCTSEGRTITVRADNAGRFNASPEFEVTSAHAEADDYVPVEGEYGDNWTRVGGRRSITLKLRHDPFVEVEGTVVKEANVPVEGVSVAASSDRRRMESTDAAGRFKLKLRSSETQIWVYRKGFEQRLYPRTKGPMQIALVRRPAMAVYLIDAAGQPVRGFNLVEAFNSNGLRVGDSRTREAEGDCTLEGQLGELTVRATVGGKTVTKKVTLKDTQKLDVTLVF